MNEPVRRSDLVSISAKVLQSLGDGTNWTRYKRLDSTCSRKTLLPRLMDVKRRIYRLCHSRWNSVVLMDLDSQVTVYTCRQDQARSRHNMLWRAVPRAPPSHPVRPTCLIDPRKGYTWTSRIRAGRHHQRAAYSLSTTQLPNTSTTANDIGQHSRKAGFLLLSSKNLFFLTHHPTSFNLQHRQLASATIHYSPLSTLDLLRPPTQ